MKGLVRSNGFVSRKTSRENPFYVPSWDDWTLQLDWTAGLLITTEGFFVFRPFFILWHRILNLRKSPFKTQLVLSACRLSACDSLYVCVCVRARLSRVFDRSSPPGRMFLSLRHETLRAVVCVWTSAPVCLGVLLLHLFCLCVLMGSTVPRFFVLFFFPPYPTCCTNCPAIFRQ